MRFTIYIQANRLLKPTMSSKEKEPNNVDASPSVDASPPVEDSNEKREANNYLLASTMMRDFAAAKRWVSE